MPPRRRRPMLPSRKTDAPETDPKLKTPATAPKAAAENAKAAETEDAGKKSQRGLNHVERSGRIFTNLYGLKDKS